MWQEAEEGEADPDHQHVFKKPPCKAKAKAKPQIEPEASEKKPYTSTAYGLAKKDFAQKLLDIVVLLLESCATNTRDL